MVDSARDFPHILYLIFVHIPRIVRPSWADDFFRKTFLDFLLTSRKETGILSFNAQCI